MQSNANAAVDGGIDDLVLETLPNGETAWLRPRQPEIVRRYGLNPDRVVVADVTPPDDTRYVLTDAGHSALEEHSREAIARAAAVDLLFGDDQRGIS